MKTNILVVDDDSLNLISTKEFLEACGFKVDTAERPGEALSLVANGSKEYAVVLIDFLMPEMDGATLANKIHEITDEPALLMYSADDKRETLKKCLRAPVLDFIDKDENVVALKRAIDLSVKHYERMKSLRPSTDPSENERVLKENGLIGCSTGMVRAVARAKKFREMGDAVLIVGETGSGKELIANLLHDPAQAGSFHAVNCAAYQNSTLVESELFGYEKGAFTGATQRKLGILEIANRGTVFLDELHHLGPAAQSTLLRAVREKKIRRVGGDQEIAIHCRIIAATKTDIEERVERGEFLRDLYYRLKMLQINVPALRERKEDIPLLVEYFCSQYNQRYGAQKKFLMRTIRAMEAYSWPGNVAQLQGEIVNALAGSIKNSIEPADLGPEFSEPVGLNDVLPTLVEYERKQLRDKMKYIRSVMDSSNSQRHSANRLGVSESTLRGLIERTKSKPVA
jgi:DNA-binding NtrC family response regulator